jgi:hypothetical protein
MLLSYIWSSNSSSSSNIKVAIEHGPFIVDLPMKDGDFP